MRIKNGSHSHPTLAHREMIEGELIEWDGRGGDNSGRDEDDGRLFALVIKRSDAWLV